MSEADRWWREGVVYQIYPRSFMDANGDGIGDLEGIRHKLAYLEWLGIDAVWLSPCFPSPMVDFGYDVSDYCDIGPEFGTLQDFDRLCADARKRGIRILLDLVPNHTSDRHPWFLESRSSRNSRHRDWYVWRDPRPGGEPPNNWIAVFGGSAWEMDPGTGQYYLHSFFPEQPDLNWRNPELRRAIHDVMRFWLDRGAAGFRVDVTHRILKDPELRDNPLIEGRDPGGYFGQRHINDENHPDVHEALRELRRLVDGYGDRMLVGEVYVMDPEVVASYYGDGDELHLAFNFSFLNAAWSAEAFRGEVESFEAALPDGAWPDIVLSNHDVVRHATRHAGRGRGDARARAAAALLLTLRGTPFLYYGEEIGMRNVEIPVERMQDPLARTIHPRLCRDGERTPMQWSEAADAGFGSSTPWIPFGLDVSLRNVAAQRDDPTSLLCLYRELLSLRRRTPALHRGSYRSLDLADGVFAYERACSGSLARIAINLSDEDRRVSLGPGKVVEGLSTGSGRPRPMSASELELQPDEAVVLLLG